MAVRVVGAEASGVLSVELVGTVHRACVCGEPNPSYVACARCGIFNYSGHPCRGCGGPGDLGDPWTTCPACGRSARVDEAYRGGWYRNPLKQLRQQFREWRARRKVRP